MFSAQTPHLFSKEFEGIDQLNKTLATVEQTLTNASSKFMGVPIILTIHV